MPHNSHVEECYPPCRKACPAEINIQAYIALISQGKFKEALEVIRKYIPFPAVCGRVCFSPCEEACTRKDTDEALSIRALKRLVADYELETGKKQKPSPIPKRYSEKIAIIGSGPAGLTAAYELVKKGYPVTIFDKASKPGGMLIDCLPDYRLPKEVVDREIQYIIDLGVETSTETTVGKDITLENLFEQGHKAIFVATGAPRCLDLNVEGENLDGVLHSLGFLRDVNSGKQVELGDKVAVIGGGNVAVDVARTAKRLGSGEVTIIYRRSEKEMPARHMEVEEARLEGVKLHFLASPKSFIGKNEKLVSVECLRMSLGPPDESGRRRPIPVEGTEFTVPVDTIILAIGETPDTSFLPEEVKVTKRSHIIVDPVTLETTMPGVFAGGDAVTGPASVIEAIAAGKKAAVSIDYYLRGLDLKAGREKKISETTWVANKKLLEKKPRQPIQRLTLPERLGNFREVELGLSVENGIKEAHRCLLCGPCSQCLQIEDLCEPEHVLVDKDECIACANCEKVCQYGAIKVEKSVAEVDEILCKGCGTCAVECPAMAISMSNFTNEKILASIEEAPRTWNNEPHVLAFICNWCGKIDQLKNHPNAHVVQVSCTGRVDQLHILQAFWTGAHGVLLIGCRAPDCHYGSGASVTEKRIEETKKWLNAIGIKPERLRLEQTSPYEKRGPSEILANFMSNLKDVNVDPL